MTLYSAPPSVISIMYITSLELARPDMFDLRDTLGLTVERPTDDRPITGRWAASAKLDSRSTAGPKTRRNLKSPMLKTVTRKQVRTNHSCYVYKNMAVSVLTRYLTHCMAPRTGMTGKTCTNMALSDLHNLCWIDYMNDPEIRRWCLR